MAIYIKQGATLTEMTERPYETEDLLPRLLADHPDLLLADEDSDRRLLLVQREIGVGDDADAGGRWSVDHLFLDQDFVPTLVEVKRSSDTRIRREVVGQLLDYAANASSYWSVERIRAAFEAAPGRRRRSRRGAGRAHRSRRRATFGLCLSPTRSRTSCGGSSSSSTSR